MVNNERPKAFPSRLMGNYFSTWKLRALCESCLPRVAFPTSCIARTHFLLDVQVHRRVKIIGVEAKYENLAELSRKY